MSVILYSSFLIICALSSIGAQKCNGVMDLQLQDNLIMGVFPPFGENGKLNYSAISVMAQYYKCKKVKVIYVAGFFGGGPAIPLPERKRLAKEWEKQANCLDFDLIIEVGAMPFLDALEMARYCSTLNVTAITFYAEIVYQASTLPEALEDLQRICDATGSKIPLMYHESTAVDQKISTVQIFKGARGGGVSCFVGVATTINTFLDTKAAVDSIDCYQFWGLGTALIAASIKIGMNASLSINMYPDLGYKIKDAVSSCKLELATDIQQVINRRMAVVANTNDTIDTTSRTFNENARATYQLLSCIDIGYRYPWKKPNAAVTNQIASNLEDLGVCLCNSDDYQNLCCSDYYQNCTNKI